jgi:UDP-3-O-[3-hydroxymyristoyl] glucosamine N-acyltransferase
MTKLRRSLSSATIAALLELPTDDLPKTTFTGIATLKKAGPLDISFLIDKKYLNDLEATQAGLVLLSPDFAPFCKVPHIATKTPHLAYTKISHAMHDKEISAGIHPTACIAKSATVHSSASIGPFVVIGEHSLIDKNVVIAAHTMLGDFCHIGEGTILKSGVHIGDMVRMGKHCTIESGAVIGADGFGNTKDRECWVKVPQLGGVVIGDDVDIGANTTIDCGAIDDTIIGNNVRIDNLVQIAHNVQIGDHTAIAGCAGIAGSAIIGKRCLIGGQTGINGHITICDDAIFTGASMVTHSITSPGVYSSGTGLLTSAEWKRSIVHFRHLDSLHKKIKQLEAYLL